MKSNKKSIGKILRKHGYGFPESEEEVNSYEKKRSESYKKPKKWPELNDIITGNGEPKSIIEFKSNINNSSSNLAMAAREEKEIPKIIEEKMKRDKNDARKK